MRIHSVTLKNFRSYFGEVEISFDNLTALVGSNDIGKSSIMEALDIFFNDDKGAVKLDKNDLNVDAEKNNDTEISIGVSFCDLPEHIVIDSASKTNLSKEFLLNADGHLEIIKRYPNAGKARIFIRSNNPRNPICADLVQKKDKELRDIIDYNKITCADKSRNPVMRAAIWDHCRNDLQLELTDIDVTKGDAKSIWDRLQKYLPHYFLFQADRKNSDTDHEVQDPLKAEVANILKSAELQPMLDTIANAVVTALNAKANNALSKLSKINPEIAGTLKPVIPTADSLKWTDVFKNVSISGDDSIPVNKRGSGTRRLILLSFFQAAVEEKDKDTARNGTIFAIEEPETALHDDNQKKMITALKELARAENTQVIITTHSASVVKQLDLSCVRVIRDDQGRKVANNALPRVLDYISLNEVSYLAFGGAAEEYHSELYGYLDQTKQNGKKLKSAYTQGKKTFKYKRLLDNGSTKDEDKILTEIIRHQIHHPENQMNAPYTTEDLETSINEMRKFIMASKTPAPSK